MTMKPSIITLAYKLLFTASITTLYSCAQAEPNTHLATSPEIHVATAEYQYYQQALTAIKNDDSLFISDFLTHFPDSSMRNKVANEWLKQLARTNRWHEFSTVYQQIPHNAHEQETQCYAQLAKIDHNPSLKRTLAWQLTVLPEGCNQYLYSVAQDKDIQSLIQRRILGLWSSNHQTEAQKLAAAQGYPIETSSTSSPNAATQLRYIISKDGQKSFQAALDLLTISDELSATERGFAWGILARRQALNQNAETALDYFERADTSLLSDDMWAWYARSALRIRNWNKLQNIIQTMPKNLQQQPTWQYWLGKSWEALGNKEIAIPYYKQAAQSGRNFYAILATEALGEKPQIINNVDHSTAHQIQKISNRSNIQRALSLFHLVNQQNDWAIRRQAQNEWRYAVQNYTEDELLAASSLALQQGFYEMAIYSADRTHDKLNYALRYITPFRNITETYAKQVGIDPAWVYGLIRQESRFMVGVRSSAGAKGLMQIMPSTAKDIARKIGIPIQQLNNTEGNIRMGTWYMSNLLAQLGHPVLATAGYNAGPNRAKRWQANTPLPGAIYAETIPFDETRDYVKKVLTNTTYYHVLLGEPYHSLTERLGVIPPKP